MKIKQLDIKGFRSLKQATWTPGDLNVLIGANGTGKSNLLRFLNLISVAAEGDLGRGVQTSGDMNALVWDGQASAISFVLKTDVLGNPHQPEHYELELSRLGTGSAYSINFSNANRLREMSEAEGVVR